MGRGLAHTGSGSIAQNCVPMSVAASNVVVQQPPNHDLTRSQRLFSACFGAGLTSLLTTPFDVLKTRQQTLAMINPPAETPTAACPNPTCDSSRVSSKPFKISLGLNEGELWCYKCNTPATSGALNSSVPNGMTRVFGSFNISNRSTLGLFLQIVRSESGWHLWRGLAPTLAMSIPSTVVYFNMYDELKSIFHRTCADNSTALTFVPVASGISARVIAVTMVAPIELIRTRAQAVRGESNNLLRSAASTLREEVRLAGFRAMFRGLTPTLWRDVPFSGIYWFGYEQIKYRLAHDYHWNSPFQIAFWSGALSGMFTALVTTPFDVVKTRQQVLMIQMEEEAAASGKSRTNATVPSPNLFKSLNTIWKTEGVSGLFAGAAARVSKVAPACAIMISSYEVFKNWFAEENQKRHLN
jgi:solute carrier family 25 protein 39/40